MIPLVPVPRPGTQLPHLPLVRVKTAGIVRGVITSRSYIGVNTHFMGQRTLPCVGDDCPGCAAEKSKRWEGYLSVWTTAPSKHLIVALTPGAATQILDAAPDPNNLRGLFLTVERLGSKPNGQLRGNVEPANIEPGHLPPEPELLRHLYKIWGVDDCLLPDPNPRIAAPILDRAAQLDARNNAT